MPARLILILLALARLPAQTVTDLVGRTVVLPDRIERIVLIRGRDLHELAMLLGDDAPRRLVGIGPDLAEADGDAWEVFRARWPQLGEVPVLGSVFADAVRAEAVLALRPDLVVVDAMMRRRGYRCIERMERAGLPLLCTDATANPLTGPQRSLRLLGAVLGAGERAAAIAAACDAELAAVASRLAGVQARPLVYIECADRGPQAHGNTYGRGGAWGALVAAAGGASCAEGLIADMAPLRAEAVIAADPAVIVLTGARWAERAGALHLGYRTDPAAARATLAAYAARPGWTGLRAVRDRRVHGIFHGFCMHPDAFAAVQQLAGWLHPAVCGDLDPPARLAAFRRRFAIADGGTWMITLE